MTLTMIPATKYAKSGDFEDRGAQQLKGLPGEWHLYAIASQ